MVACSILRSTGDDARAFEVPPESFRFLPGAPFAYWVSENIRQTFVTLPALEGERYAARQGGVNGDDFRWLRLWFEPATRDANPCSSVPISKGGNYSRYYFDIHLVARWNTDRRT